MGRVRAGEESSLPLYAFVQALAHPKIFSNVRFVLVAVPRGAIPAPRARPRRPDHEHEHRAVLSV